MSSIMQGLVFESKNATYLTETVTYKLWESAGKKLVEAQLTPAQITQIFQQVEQGATAAGGNRTMIGKGVDATSAVNKAWEDLKTKVQNSGPIKNVDAMYDQAAEKLKQATGGDQGVMKYVQKYRDFAKKHPVAQSLIYAALIAAAGISGAGLGGAAALGLFKMVDKLLQGEKFSSAAYSGAKTGAMAYGASKLGDLVRGTPQGADAAASAAGNEYGALFKNASKQGFAAARNALETGQVVDYNTALSLTDQIMADVGDGLSPQAYNYLQQTIQSKLVMGLRDAALKESSNYKLTESQIFIIIGTVVERQNLQEGITDAFKGAANWVQTKGHNLTTKVTADKLMTAWEKAGKPTDSGEIVNLLAQNGVPQNVTQGVFAGMKIPTTTAPSAKPAAGAAAAAKPIAKPAAQPAAPAAPAAAKPAAPIAKPAVNPELQKRLAARKAGTPTYAGGLEETSIMKGIIDEGDTLLDPETALQQARKITKAIKYDDTVGEIIVQLQMLAERTEGIDSRTLEYSVDGVLSAKNALESAVYDLEEAFEDAVREAEYKRDEEDLDEAKQRLDPKCWTGYKKQGTKMKGGVRVNNCVPVKESAILKGLR